MEVAGCEDRMTWVGYFPVAVGAVLLSSVTSRWGKGQGSREILSSALMHWSLAAAPAAEIGLVGCLVSSDDVYNWVLNLFQSLPVFPPLKDSLHLLLSSIFLLNKHEYLKCITRWSNSSAPQVSGIILIIALITLKRLVKSFFWQTEMQIIVKKVGNAAFFSSLWNVSLRFKNACGVLGVAVDGK